MCRAGSIHSLGTNFGLLVVSLKNWPSLNEYRLAKGQ